MKSNGEALSWASKELRNNFQIVKTAVSKHGMAIYYASFDLRNNFQIVESAVR